MFIHITEREPFLIGCFYSHFLANGIPVTYITKIRYYFFLPLSVTYWTLERKLQVSDVSFVFRERFYIVTERKLSIFTK